MAGYNRTSTIRGGYDYQDFWGLQLIGNWLSNPDKYQSIQFETAPEEDDVEAFHLDDIILKDNTDKYHCYQIKFRQNSLNEWSWEELLNPGGAKKTGKTLIKKWSLSILKYSSLSGKFAYAGLHTNGIADTSIIKYLVGTKIDIDQLQKDDLDLYNQIKNEIGSDAEVKTFFELFNFNFAQSDIDEIEKQTKDLYTDTLLATDSGINNLLLQIHKECRKKYTTEIQLPTIRDWCEFDNPRPLQENFKIPDDFVLFNDDINKKILDDLKKPTGGVKIIWGGPGTGKSVYTSMLAEELQCQDFIVIRHHYHLSPDEINPEERLNTERVEEALKAQFKEHKEHLRDIANKNSANINLKNFIDEIAQSVYAQNKPFILIIDGLDHVLRSGQKVELISFLHSIFYPQPGFWLVLGMQPSVKEILPPNILHHCENDSWIELNGLSSESVREIICANKVGLQLPNQSTELEAVISKIIHITEGNPLYLRYLLSEIKVKSKDLIVREYALNWLVPYSGNINAYYERLWTNLSEEAKSILFTIGSVNFKFTTNQLFKCLTSYGYTPANVDLSFSSIIHLVKQDRADNISIYHNSFGIFILNQPDFDVQKTTLKTKIRDWLQICNEEAIRWAELSIIEYETGNSQPILSIDKTWLIDAMCHARPSYQIKAQLKTSSIAAFKEQNFTKVFFVSNLHMYFEDSATFVEDAPDLVNSEAFYHYPESIKTVELFEQSTPVLVSIAKISNDIGDFNILEEIIEILNNRTKLDNYRGEAEAAIESLVLVVSKTSHETKRVYDYIQNFSNTSFTSNLLSIYTNGLLSNWQIEKVKNLLNYQFVEIEYEAILEACFKHDLKHQTKNFINYSETNSNLWALIYRTLYGLELSTISLPDLIEKKDLPIRLPDHFRDEIQELSKIFHEQFLIGFFFALNGQSQKITDWTSDVSGWTENAVVSLLNFSNHVANAIKSQDFIRFKDCLEAFKSIVVLDWIEDRGERYGLHRALCQALSICIVDCILFQKIIDESYQLSKDDVQNITSTPFFDHDDLIDILVEHEAAILTQDALVYIQEQQILELSQHVIDFSKRATKYAKLSILNRSHKDLGSAKNLLEKAADNTIAYLYHKDMYLYEVLHALKEYMDAGMSMEEFNHWVSKLAPIIENVSEYTDGDETNYFPYIFSNILATYDSSKVFKNYYVSSKLEKYYHAEQLFHDVLSGLDYSKEESIALASTSIENESFEKLEEISLINDGAKKALDSIKNCLGKQTNKEQDKSPKFSEQDNYRKELFAITPENLQDYIRRQDDKSRWEISKEITAWFEHWSESEKQNAYKAIRLIFDQTDREDYISGELLDLLYPIAFEFDTNYAFEILCKAQTQNYGWNFNWGEKETRKRWEFLKKRFPRRYIEFLEKSLKNGNILYGKFGYYLSLWRALSFFIYFEDRETVESLMEESINFATLLMANSELPTPEWAKSSESKSEIDELVLLSHRLTWPSPLVRERSATAIGNLLNSNSSGKKVYIHLISWIAAQKLESVVALGILPLIKALENPSAIAIGFIKLSDVVEALGVNSIVIEQLLNELALRLDEDFDPGKLPDIPIIKKLPSGYTPTSFFNKYIQSYLAPTYYDNALSIERESGEPFIAYWAMTSQELGEELEISFTNQALDYLGRSPDELLTGMSTKLSEVYRSAYLRTLAHFFKKGSLKIENYLDDAYSTLPIDLSFWRLNPNRIPEWWPQLKSGPGELELISPISSLIEYETDEILLYADGAITPGGGWSKENSQSSFSLTPFAYSKEGDQIPTAEEIAKFLEQKPILIVHPESDRPLNYFENNSNYVPIYLNKSYKIKDLTIVPLIARIKTHPIILWQFYRAINWPVFPLIQSIGNDGMNIDIKENTLHWIVKGNPIATYSDWTEGIEERGSEKKETPHGQYLKINKNFLEEELEEKQLNLGYLISSKYGYQKSSYENVNYSEYHKIIFDSPIMTIEQNLNSKINLRRFDQLLKTLTPEEIESHQKEEQEAGLIEHRQFKEAYAKNFCYLCNKPFKTISAKNPCLHWLLRRCKFKKKQFNLIYEKYDFHHIAAYLRWVANEEKFLRNINDLSSEIGENKVISQTIKWKNIEWTFDCSEGDYNGHVGSRVDYPHYHFQMRIDNRQFINFNDYHIPLSEQDIFNIELSKHRGDVFEHSFGPGGAGMQNAIEVDPELILEHAKSSNSDEDAVYRVFSVINTIEEPITAEMMNNIVEEHKLTGKTIASLMKKYLPESASMFSEISPAETIPEISKRTEHKRGKKSSS